MSLSTATLSTQLQGISALTEIAARNAWADAWAAYFAGAITDNGVTFTGNGGDVATAKAAMSGAMAGLSTDGPAAIQAGISAWWSHLAGAPGTYFAGATSIAAPSNLTTIASAMEADVFVANRLEATKAAAMDRLAGFLHTKNAGGSALISGVGRTIS